MKSFLHLRTHFLICFESQAGMITVSLNRWADENCCCSAEVENLPFKLSRCCVNPPGRPGEKEQPVESQKTTEQLVLQGGRRRRVG